ncbi:MAG: hypothetical protein CMO55_07765 [Verrucomicrobiales bacterium]|nr:hypothetical protein [Verrucomicrobiales bacterium]
MSGKIFRWMDDQTDIPESLKPDKHYGHLNAFQLTKLWKTLDDFTKAFGIELEATILATLAGLAHAMGGLVRTSTTFGSIEPPFSLLLVTPEANPVWTEVPVRFLSHEFNASMRQSLEMFLSQKRMEGCKKDEDPSDTSLKDSADLAKRLFMDGMVERIATSSLQFPFPRAPIDNHVLVTTPPTGITRALRQLQPLQKFQLENALSTGARLVAPNGVRSSGVPGFYWQVCKRDLPALIEENPWFIGVPFALLETSKSGNAVVDPYSPPVHDLLYRCKDLATMRHAAMGNSRQFRTDGKDFRAYQEFLERAQAEERRWEYDTILPPLRIAELGLKFTSILAVLEGKRQPEMLEIKLGLELAKRAAVKRHRVLQAALPQQPDEMARPHLEGLSSRERAVFLRVVERGGLTKTELGRSFNCMRKEERDKILSTLVVRNLVEIRSRGIYASAN